MRVCAYIYIDRSLEVHYMSGRSEDEGCCDVELVHGTTVASVRRRLPDSEAVDTAAERFKILGDPTRLRILLALSLSELCVCDLASVAGAAQPVVSQHLKILRAYRLVQYRKQGRMAFYSLSDVHLRALLGGLFAFGDLGEQSTECIVNS
jgi:ArsR family transcriptional regulator